MFAIQAEYFHRLGQSTSENKVKVLRNINIVLRYVCRSIFI